jgi:hypothetical protein
MPTQLVYTRPFACSGSNNGSSSCLLVHVAMQYCVSAVSATDVIDGYASYHHGAQENTPILTH